jgi:acetyl-CoA synthetase
LFFGKLHSAHAYPRLVEFVSELPKTPSGKIQRFLLRNQEIAQLNVGKHVQKAVFLQID